MLSAPTSDSLFRINIKHLKKLFPIVYEEILRDEKEDALRRLTTNDFLDKVELKDG